MQFKLVNETGPLQECECCGCYGDENVRIYVNDVEVWYYLRDNHMWADKTEESLVECVLSAWNDTVIEGVIEESTEEKRLQWNEDHPGNGIASTPESWKQYQLDTGLQYQRESYSSVLEACKVLPSEEWLQLQMIALWIEDFTGEKVDVVEENVSLGENDE